MFCKSLNIWNPSRGYCCVSLVPLVLLMSLRTAVEVRRRCGWRIWLRHCATSRKVTVSIPGAVIVIFFLLTSFRPHYCPGVGLASNRNEYQEYFLGVKVVGAWGWQPYHDHVAIVLKFCSLGLLEPPGPVQACNGIACTFCVFLNRLYLVLSKCLPRFLNWSLLVDLHIFLQAACLFMPNHLSSKVIPN